MSDLIRSIDDPNIDPFTNDTAGEVLDIEKLRAIAKEATKTDGTVDKNAAMLMIVQMVKEATKDTQTEGYHSPRYIADSIDSLLKHPLLKGLPKPMSRNYKAAPINRFDDILKFIIPDRRKLSEDHPVNKFFEHRRLIVLLSDLENMGQEGKELADIVEQQMAIVSRTVLAGFFNSNFNIINQLETEKRLEQAGKLLPPSKEQLGVIRSLSAFIQNPNIKAEENNQFSSWIYLKGPAGTGKTQIVLPWALKSANISTSNVISLGHNDMTSKGISKALGTPYHTKESLLKMIDSGNLTPNIELIVIDEAAGFNRVDLTAVAEAIQKANLQRKDNPVKVISLGDPNQITQVGAFDAPITNRPIESVSPLSVIYRTNIPALSNFQELFKGKRTKVRGQELPAELNQPNPFYTGESGGFVLKGVWGIGAPSGSQVRDEILRRLNEVKETDTTKVIVTLPNKVEDYQNMLNSMGIDKVTVLPYAEIQGATVDEIYIDIPYLPQFFTTEQEYNAAIYMTTS